MAGLFSAAGKALAKTRIALRPKRTRLERKTKQRVRPLVRAAKRRRKEREQDELQAKAEQAKRGPAKTRRAAANAGKRKAKAPEPKRRAPRNGKIDAFGWFMLAVVILAWPREKSLGEDLKRTLGRFWPGAAARTSAEDVAFAEIREPGRGRGARNPRQIPARGWKDILWRTWRDFNQDQIMSVAGSVTFFGLLALFPAMGAFVSLYGLFADVATAQKHLSLLAGVLPADALTLIGDQMIRLAKARSASLGFAFVISLLVSIWSANGGMRALINGLNIAFEEKEKRGLVKLNLTSLAFTFGALVFLLLSIGAIVAIPLVMGVFGFGQGDLMPLLRWPLLFVLVVIAIGALYRYGPSRQHERWKWLTWGSVIAAVLWLLASLLFSAYVAHFGHYDKTYGSLGAVIGFMSWMWVSSIVILFGAELNSEIEHQTAVDTTTGRPEPLGRRGATMADTIGQARPAKPRKPKTKSRA